MSASSRYVAGGMSGTSADGVDVAIVQIDGRGYDMSARLIVHHHRPYNAELRREIFAFRGAGGGSVSQDTLARLAKLGREISLAYASAVNEALAAARLEAKNLAAVAAHGQTLFHDPPNTIQWLDPSLLAAAVGCAVVSDFRRADLAAGGQGAPLVPFADYILFRDATKNRVLLNLGGIANITILSASTPLERVVAFDTGPANCISDWLMRTRGPAGAEVDTDGRRASGGRVIHEIVTAMLKEEYFERPPPKSTDGPAMIAMFERAMGAAPAAEPSLDDLLATAAFVTASSIEHAIGRVAPFHPDDMELIASGGGTRNAAIMAGLRELLGRSRCLTTDEVGVSSEAKEAIAFALLGAATLDGVPSNVPSVTGASRAVVLGSVTPRP